MKLFLVPLAFAAGIAAADPYVPASDGEVLATVRAVEVLASGSGTVAAQLAALRANRDSALAGAASLVRMADETRDGRLAGYAESLVEPWAARRDPKALVLRATLRQKIHRFDDSLVDLDAALQLVPDDQQALLTRASIRQVRGDFAGAAEDCGKLAASLVATVCIEAARSMEGDAKSAYERLAAKLETAHTFDPKIAAWTLGVLADMRLRLGDATTAEQHLKSALGLVPGDAYALVTYADLLLAAGRDGEVETLLASRADVDPLLVRLAIAQKRLARPGAAATAERLRANFAAARERGLPVHEREEAMLALDVDGDAAKALELARANWRNQRERIDADLLARAERGVP